MALADTGSIITIVTPSYNQGFFLGDAIKSVLSQEGDFLLDYHIRDGGSADGSVGIIKDWANKLEATLSVREIGGHSWLCPSEKASIVRCWGVSLRWHSGKDKGQSQAINHGFGLGIGDLAGWVNSDDVLMSGTLSRALHFYRTTEKVVFGKALATDEAGTEKWTQAFWKKHLTFFDCFTLEYAPPQPSVFFPLSLFREVGGLDEDLHYLLDVDLWQRMLLVTGSFHYVPEIWSRQTYHPAAKSMRGGGLFEAFKEEKIQVYAKRSQQLGTRVLLLTARKYLRSRYLRTFDFFKHVVRFLLKKLVKSKARPSGSHSSAVGP